MTGTVHRPMELADRQVVFATSEASEKLAGMLDGLNHNTINFNGKVLKPRTD